MNLVAEVTALAPVDHIALTVRHRARSAKLLPAPWRTISSARRSAGSPRQTTAERQLLVRCHNHATTMWGRTVDRATRVLTTGRLRRYNNCVPVPDFDLA